MKYLVEQEISLEVYDDSVRNLNDTKKKLDTMKEPDNHISQVMSEEKLSFKDAIVFEKKQIDEAIQMNLNTKDYYRRLGEAYEKNIKSIPTEVLDGSNVERLSVNTDL